MTKQEKKILAEFLDMIACSVGARGGELEGEEEDNEREISLFNQLATKCGVRKL